MKKIIINNLEYQTLKQVIHTLLEKKKKKVLQRYLKCSLDDYGITGGENLNMMLENQKSGYTSGGNR